MLNYNTKTDKWTKFDHSEMTILEALDSLSVIVDDSDPDVIINYYNDNNNNNNNTILTLQYETTVIIIKCMIHINNE